ncbi:hypothetical protein SAMD00019534_113170, partial [Acytostelium subglobosum LB1]|uniref:hypothetical protein n=1 Tax=Acytostelium subglobosum LB1 TaxID=1410327 RepID=UPI000644FC02
FVSQPNPSNLLEWHYVLYGAEGTPYYGGAYHGQLIFPSEFPHKPPSILMSTPSARFECDTRLCVSISDQSEDADGAGSISASQSVRRKAAAESMMYNVKNPVFKRMFPEIAKEYIIKRKELKALASTASSSSSSSSSKSSTTATPLPQDRPAREADDSTATTAIVVIGIFIIVFSAIVYYYYHNKG